VAAALMPANPEMVAATAIARSWIPLPAEIFRKSIDILIPAPEMHRGPQNLRRSWY
jgi:hypothetical protein